MAALRLFQSLGWPVAAGLLIALLTLLVFPELRPAPLLDASPRNSSASQPQTLHSYADAVDRAAPAVVNIYTRKTLELNRHPLEGHPLYRHLQRNPDQPQQQRRQLALGSGVIVDTRGYLLTNEHVIRGAEDILVLLHDGRETRAQLVGTDPDSDLAVLKIELNQLTAIEVGEPTHARVGDIVLAIGNPFGVGQTVTQGIISATGRWNLNISEYENFLQTDAAINVGNSGGALVDTQGRLLGINTAILRESEFLGQSEFSVGVSFAIPADTAMNSLREIIEHGRVVRGWLGLEAQPLTPQLAREFSVEPGIEGVLVTAIYADSPAHVAGLNPGDILTHIDDQSVGEDGRRGMNQIAATEPGSEVTLQVVRDGRRLRLEAVISERPTESS
ncbi:S1C family serine protease [Marinimicrobium sp. ABcell2]|uniref:S1C family serine protease n=1 Tax=Marinimicrobium sp. ABcell2 TaxID=3069751 RepID=UPI0027B7F0CE|nr:trypsin-like peptidase domain-containing protein [Marinimicrobium sp. ABcell2]MDQ2078262.1 trypsin-like peptidase domain-containing protein [Marinimicrobium sp. ABcell2]